MITSDPSANLDDPGPSEPANLVLLDEDGKPASRVKVWTELGTPIYFSPQTREFTAHLSDLTSGRGSTSELSSSQFDTLLMKIRERCLVLPVRGYQLRINDYTDDEARMIEVTSCDVIEYHPRRVQPYVIRVQEEWGGPRHRVAGTPMTYVPRVRTVEFVYLPQPEHVEALRAAVRAMRAEVRRHADEERRLKALLKAAVDATPKLLPSDLRHVQETGQQAAVPPHELGAVVFDLTDEEDE